MKTPPKVQVDTMPAGKYFAYAAELLKLHPPHLTDEPILAQMKRIGIEPGKSFDIEKVSPAVKKALESAPEAAQKLMEWKLPTLARVANHWSMNTDTMGVYGNYYLKRAIVAQHRSRREPARRCDLSAQSRRRSRQAARRRQQIHAALREGRHAASECLLVGHALRPGGLPGRNSLNRFAVSSWMPFKYDPDGSLTLYFQNESPGKDKEANWLPAPKGGFNLTMRLYGPKSDALTGRWNPPPVTRSQGLPMLGAQ